nr:ERBB-3 binding protein 1-like [Tanacetum cinerariifolium]
MKGDGSAKVAEALQLVLSECKPKAKIVDICEKGDSFIIEQTGNIYKNVKKKIERGVAFPTCLFVNNTICHYSPLASKESVLEEEVMSENSDNESSNSGYVGTKRKRKRSRRVISLEEIQKHTRKPIDEAAAIHNGSMSMVGKSFTNQQEQTNLPHVRAQPKMSVIEQHIENTAANTVQYLTVEATYKENTVRFPFILSDGLVTLEGLIAKRFLLSLGSFKLKYEDKDGDMILVAIDKDLEGSVGDSRQPVDPTVIKLVVKDRCPSELALTLGPYFA